MASVPTKRWKSPYITHSDDFQNRNQPTDSAEEALILPLSETEFLKEPFICLRGADYWHFDARYGVNPATADAEMRSHWEWLESMSGSSPTRSGTFGTNVKRLLTEQRTFGDSYSNLGLQLFAAIS
jgi:hypothetical protein